jgi:acyl-coenzyme A synthetase/AMP-(fatty) acid ligase
LQLLRVWRRKSGEGRQKSLSRGIHRSTEGALAGFCLNSMFDSWRGLHDIVERHATTHPETCAATDEYGTWTYAQLQDASLRAAAVLKAKGIVGDPPPRWLEQSEMPRPLALVMNRGRAWYAYCIAAWRLGLAVAASDNDMTDKAGLRERKARIARDLRPKAAVVDESIEGLPELPEDCVVISVKMLEQAMEQVHPHNGGLDLSSPVGPESPLLYVYTGGTTKHSKCLVVTHAMALWEMKHYHVALQKSMKPSDRVLQFTSTFWGAAAFGQIDMALAFGCCCVFSRAHSVSEIKEATESHRISVLGFVPSQLRGGWPGGPVTRPPDLRIVVTWGEKLPVKLARQWRDHKVDVFELLIASEYWLALYTDCKVWKDPSDGIEKHVLQPLPELDMLLLKEDGKPAGEGEIGELYITGPTVSAGYMTADGRVGVGEVNENAYVWLEGRRYLRTKDNLRRLRKSEGGGLVYYGRAGTLVKRGGAWADLEELEAKASNVQGISQACLIDVDGVIHAFLVLEPTQEKPLLRVLDQATRALGGEPTLHVRHELPLHAATAKVDRRGLKGQVENVRTRETEFQTMLATKQWGMLRAYFSRIVFAFLVMTIPTFLLHPFPDSLPVALARLLLFPYVWGAAMFTIMAPGQDGRFYSWPLGPPDILLLFVALLPSLCIGPVVALCCASSLWVRDRSKVGAYGLIALFLGLLFRAGRGDSFTPLLSIALSVGIGFFLRPSTNLPGLPVTCYLNFPKWLDNDWSWRLMCQEARVRTWLSKHLFRERPYWGDQTWWWDATNARVDFYSTVRLDWKAKDPAVLVNFWKEPELEQPQAANGTTNGNHKSGGKARNPQAQALATLIERAGGCPDSLSGLDSLQAISLAELIRKSTGRDVSVAALLRCSDVEELASYVSSQPSSESEQERQLKSSSEDPEGRPDRNGDFRQFALAFPRHPVDWCIKHPQTAHIDLYALQKAVDRLVLRHSAMRTLQTPDEPLRECLDRAASLWQIIVSSLGGHSRAWELITKFVSASLFACWPRTVVQKPPLSFQKGSSTYGIVPIKVPEGPEVRDPRWDDTPDDLYALSTIRQLNSPNPRWPFEVTVVPLYKGNGDGLGDGKTFKNAAEVAVQLPVEEVNWYIYCSLTHAYSDGASGQPLVIDLLRFYDEERRARGLPPVASEGGGASPSDEIPEHMCLLQRRLRASLRGRLRGTGDPNNDVYHEVNDEDWGKRTGISRRVFFTPCVMQALRFSAATKLGCSIDVAWLTAICGSVFRLFPQQKCIRLMLKVACRDGPGEREMVGFLSEQRILPVDVVESEASTLVDIARRIDNGRRMRAWRAPEPFEPGLSVYVNVVSAMTDGLPSGFQHVTKPIANLPQRRNCSAYAHLNVRIDQLKADEWDFRIFHFDGAWGVDWSDHFALALGAVIYDMAVAPTSPLLPEKGSPPAWVLNRLSRDSWKRDSNGSSTWSTEEPASKVPRLTGETNGSSTNGGSTTWTNGGNNTTWANGVSTNSS